MKHVAIVVGHHGKGTGASIGGRDEFELCHKIAQEVLATWSTANTNATVHLIELDQDLGDWPLIQRLSRKKFGGIPYLGKWTSIDMKVAKIRETDFDAVIEIHLNRYIENTLFRRKAVGNEIWIRRTASAATVRFGQILEERIGKASGNRRRGLRRKNFRLLRSLPAHIPAAIIEPGFLTEDRVVSVSWQSDIGQAIEDSIQELFNP